MNEEVLKKLEEAPNRKFKIIVNALILIAVLAWSFSGMSSSGSNVKAVKIAKNIFTGIFSPDWTYFNLGEKGVPYLLFETISIAFLGTLTGAILAIPFGFLSAPNIVPKWLSYLTRFVLILIRTIPVLVWGLLFIRVVGPGPFAGVITMGVTSIGMLSKLFSEAIQDINKDILESLSALGLTTFGKIRYGIIPQLSATFISTVMYRFDINLRDATVLGLAGAGGIGAPLIFSINSFKWHQVGSLLLGLIVLVLFIEWVSSKVRTKLVRGY